MDYRYVIVEKEGPISRIIFNRPEKLNVMDFPGDTGIYDDFMAALDEIAKDDAIKVTIIKGAGRAFCAGHDLARIYKVYEEHDEEPGKRRPSQRARLNTDTGWLSGHQKYLLFPKITIAQVHGHCIGEGALFAEMSDITIVADDAKISHAEQRLGFAGSGMNVIPLYQAVGYKRARWMLLTGNAINGVEAAQFGWASLSVPYDDLDKEVEKTAQQMALLPRDGIAIGKATNHMVCDILGMNQGSAIGIVSHTLFTNLRYEKDEFNFVKQRKDHGERAGFHQRDDRYDKMS